jgi:7-cyano-7-deazaguanine synthase
MTNAQKKAVILLSGGLDSSTTLAIAKEQGFDVHALSFAYGQRHTVELERAKDIAAVCGVADHRIANIDLTLFAGSALTSAIEVPKDRDMDVEDAIPVTYVPARNTIFLSFALAFAESIGAYTLFIGVNALDYSGYPDCRPEYIEAFEKMANLATAAGTKEGGRFSIQTPLIALTKAEIIKKGMDLGVDYSMTVSCYDPVEALACGRCDACQLRLKGFRENGIEDPADYVVKE